jgi:hypothetical protein
MDQESTKNGLCNVMVVTETGELDLLMPRDQVLLGLLNLLDESRREDPGVWFIFGYAIPYEDIHYVRAQDHEGTPITLMNGSSATEYMAEIVDGFIVKLTDGSTM